MGDGSDTIPHFYLGDYIVLCEFFYTILSRLGGVFSKSVVGFRAVKEEGVSKNKKIHRRKMSVVKTLKTKGRNETKKA